MYKDRDKQRETTRMRVRRYREKRNNVTPKAVTPVTPSPNVTPPTFVVTPTPLADVPLVMPVFMPAPKPDKKWGHR